MSAVLADREFRALWFSEAVSVGGDQLTRVALAILVYQRTGSAFYAAGIYALTFLPALAGGLGLSQLADRYRRRNLMVVCALLQAAVVALMAIPHMPLWALFLLVIIVPMVQSPAMAAQNATLREIYTDDAMYMRSQDLRGITTNTTMLLGLGGGGLLVSAIGASWALIIDAGTFTIAAFLTWRNVVNRPPAGSKNDGWFDGAKWVFGDRKLRVLLTLSWLVGLAVIPEGLAAPLAKEAGAAPEAVGWLLAADPLGFILGTFAISHFVPARHRPRLIGVLATASVGFLVLFAVKPSLPAALVVLFLAGAVGAYQITVMAVFNTLVPNEIRGGAFGAARTGLRVSQGLGVALGGLVAELIGSAMTTVALAGLLGVLIAVPAGLMWGRLNDSAASAPAPAEAPTDSREAA
ncbi:MFS transporter [Actinokineospora auranticolor]|uniref:Putative MFS family arabinose efflux permease n=1 Tax=Actinokineospora auranticolor TaxID=155976 RepID=A0A2S6GUP2_9PSEU|nr:MFS transporter [Actinokineospora auranticolor]PPK68965.1 putative MFS family arabinose efflux permease [Actinokineospora auranticolor]